MPCIIKMCAGGTGASACTGPRSPSETPGVPAHASSKEGYANICWTTGGTSGVVVWADMNAKKFGSSVVPAPVTMLAGTLFHHALPTRLGDPDLLYSVVAPS